MESCCGSVVVIAIVPVALPIAVSIAFMIPIAIAVRRAVIPVMFVVPAVIVFHPAVLSLPVAGKEVLPVMMRRHPASAFVWWPAPIACMPPVVASHRIPIALYPKESGARAWGSANHASRRWRTNSDSQRNLRCHYAYAAQQHGSD
jgi:hypothetical protein